MSRRNRRAKASSSPVTYKGAAIGGGGSSNVFDAVRDAGIGKRGQFDTYWYCYTKHPWVYACVQAIAKAISSEGFTVQSGFGQDAKKLTDKDDPRIGQIGQFLNAAFSDSTFRGSMESLAIDMRVFALAYWRKKYVSKLCVGLERLDPRLVSIRLSADRTSIDSFVLKKEANGDDQAPTQNNSERIDPKEIVFFRIPGGDSIMGQPSPLETLDLTIAQELMTRRHRTSFFRNGATTGLMLINKDGDIDQIKAAEAQIRIQKSGPENAFKTLVLAGEWNALSPGASSGKNDVDFVKGSGLAREDISAAYHVPPGKLLFAGSALGSSGKSEDDATFYEWAVLPLEEVIYETITRELLHKEFGETDLALVPKRRNRLRLDRFDAAMNVVKFGGTGNEARDMVGLDPIDDNPDLDMNIPLFLGSKAPTIADVEPIAGAEPTPQGGAVEDNVQKQTTNEVAQKGAKRFRKATRRHLATHESLVVDATPSLAAAIRKVHAAAVAPILDAFPTEKATTPAKKRALTASEIAIIEAAIDDMDGDGYSAAIYDAAQILVEAGWGNARELLDLDTGFDVVPDAAYDAAKHEAVTFGKLVADREKPALRDVLQNALAGGFSVDDTARAMKDAVGNVHLDSTADGRTIAVDDWANMVARTELSRAANIGSFALYGAAGVKKLRWMAAGGETTCDECLDADDEVVDIGDDFPGVDTDSPPAHPNCVCTTVPADDDLGDFRT